jgi:ribosomal protein L40E
MAETSLVTCRNCGGESPHDARFCIECGETLALAIGPTTKLATPTCQSCGTENLPDASFCGICGRAMQGVAPIPQAWPTPVGYSVPQRAPAPQVTARPASVEEPPFVPIAPQSITTAPRHQRRRNYTGQRGGLPLAAVVALIGFGAVAILHAMSWPAIMLVLAAVFLVHQAEHGRAQHAIRTIAIVGMGAVLMSNPRFWPILVVGFGLMKLFGGRRIF